MATGQYPAAYGLCAALLGTPIFVGAQTIELQLTNDALLRGELVQQRDDRTLVDLGFSVINVPAEQILASRIPEQAEQASADDGRLYHFAPQQAVLSVSDNIARCAEAVVQVRTPTGLGSGFIIHPDGYLITNHHVIAGEHDLSVTLFEQGEQELRKVLFDKVRIVALDAEADLALLKVEPGAGESLPSVPLGDAGALVQGQRVFSIGSPLGFDRTISQGIVSLRNRVVDGKLYIQSTAQINPGNSGGPLFDLGGRVVGVNNMKIGSVGIEGLSFAIPSRTLTTFLDNADAFAFDTTHPNSGYRYHRPPRIQSSSEHGDKMP